MDTSGKSADGTERTTRRIRTLAEKLAILREAAEPGSSLAAVARKHGMNSNLLFSWRRLHRQGLLESQRHMKPVPLLPVKVATPTLTPTEPRSARAVIRRKGGSAVQPSMSEACVELLLCDGTRVRVFGEAQRIVLERLLERLVHR